MKSINRVWLLLSLICLALLDGSIQGRLASQEKVSAAAPNQEMQIDPSVTRLDAATRRVVASMESRDRYRVVVTEKWVLDGRAEASGENQFSLSVWHGGAFDLRIGAQEEGKQSLECRSDGVMLTRILKRPGGAIFSQQPGSLIDLLEDVLTETSLRNSGLDLLYRELPDQYLMTMAGAVEFIGSEELASGRADHFGFNWGGDPANRKELWFALDDAPRLLKVVTTVDFAAGEKDGHTLRVESNLKWEPEAQVPESPVAVEIPSGAKHVSDLYGYLLEGATRELIGQCCSTACTRLARRIEVGLVTPPR